MAVQLKPEHIHLLNQIAKKENMENFIMETKTMDQEGYLSRIVLVTMKDGRKQLDLAVKLRHSTGFQNFETAIVYKVEIFMYETVFDVFEKFTRNSGMKNLTLNVPKYYGRHELDCLVMENLNVSEYRLWNRKVPMNSEHLSLVMKSYAKLHSVSFAMKNKEPAQFAELVKGLLKCRDNENLQAYADFFKNALQAGFIASKGSARASGIMVKLQEKMPKIEEIFKFDLDSHVLVHADCHPNNMMFKYDSSKNPLTVSLIDWQMVRLSTPVLDLAYFLLTCSSKNDLDNYKKYLKLYHDELSRNLTEMSCNPDEIFPYSQLELHWQKCSIIGMYTALLVIKLSLFEKSEIGHEEEGGDFYKQFSIDQINADEYKKRILDVLFFMEEKHLV
ncbi:unnamed protein product [Acanthoscelides obtectus]|uniref:CHK kinase-like domain-containing protein n=1 Tax=Acanthoscelides obtectus TaxID=200917 RepID=A0A9P0JIV5_ACAOB|nr:unnamed protein product [Acanthoscelides obtectus]CAK1661385.1 hypothetical protein AOBTE_LOCUS22594 [Acanthoscelides obtectus]